METESPYYQNKEQKRMLRQVSPTEAIELQVLGRDLGSFFKHLHGKITYPSAERLKEELTKLQPATAEEWESLMNEYLQVNKAKLALIDNYRQKQYENGKLKL
jgi:hypothetical protein